MENGINKTGFFNATVEPHLRPISDLGIGFYNLDENTAELRFQLSNSAGTLLISDENLKVYGYFESSNGSVSDVIELDIVDELNGIVEITLDQDFLHASTSTKVKGQLYIGVQNVSGKPEYNEVAVLGEFTFEVADALINKISSFTKVEYIRMFSQLKAQIEKEVQDIQDAIANGADYVAEMNTVKEQGITAINKTVTDGKNYIDNVIANYQGQVNSAKDDAIKDMNTTKDSAISSMNAKVSESVRNVDNSSKGAIEHVDGKILEFNTQIEENSFVQPTDLDNKLNDLQWQKYKLTNDDGTFPNVSLNGNLDNLHALQPGNYYTSNTPITGVSSTAGFTRVELREGTIKRITFRPYNSTQIWLKRFYNTWSEWERVDVTQTDTGWIPFQLINGALSNTAFKSEGDGGFDCAYRTITNGDKIEKRIRINASNLTHLQQIATLPTNFAKNVQFHYVRVPINCGYGLVGIYPNGNMYVYIESDKRVDWDSSSNNFYFYGEISWVE